MVAGDFNEVVTASEKAGGAPVDMRRCLSVGAIKGFLKGWIGALGIKF